VVLRRLIDCPSLNNQQASQRQTRVKQKGVVTIVGESHTYSIFVLCMRAVKKHSLLVFYL